MDKKDDSILIVDDYPKNIQFLAGILSKAGYDIAYAVSGKEALEWVNDKKFSLILLDIMMPEMDGYEVCRILKSNSLTKEIPVIFLTAKTEIESITQAFETGAVDYITKPVNTAELLVRVKTHISIQKQKNELRELNLLKDRMFSILAHDLKTPFNTILGFSDLVLQNANRYTPEKTENLLRLINISSKQAFNLLENLLEWSRNQIRVNKLRKENLNVYQLICELVDFFNNELFRKEIEFKNLIEPEVFIIADRNMVLLIFRNLISNAVKFTPSGGCISVFSTFKDNYIEFSVEDTGQGISAEDASKLFKPEIIVTTRGTDNEKGTGLGLMVCKEFTEAHGGTINFESTEGKGTRFYFTIPL